MLSEEWISPVAAAAGVLALAAVSLAAWGKSQSSAPSKTTKQTIQKPNTPAGDVWEERRRAGIQAHSFNKREDTTDKPFASSYYYAHNNSKRTGGYADGLGMEDYTMNGPRLLSRNGKPVVEEETSEETANVVDGKRKDGVEAPYNSRTGTEDASNPTRSKKRCLAISRYLWDDPGNSKGIATIRIDQLPDPRQSHQCVPYQEVELTDISALLVDDGLLVRLESVEVQYRLHIPKLYGKASEVSTVPKQKRLLVKIQKANGSLLNRTNKQAWPHPQKKSV